MMPHQSSFPYHLSELAHLRYNNATTTPKLSSVSSDYNVGGGGGGKKIKHATKDKKNSVNSNTFSKNKILKFKAANLIKL
jgi:hypothetical protein